MANNKRGVSSRYRRLQIGLFTLLLGFAVVFTGCEKIKEAQDSIREAREGVPAAAAQELPVFAVNTTQAVQGQIRDYLGLSGDIVAGSTVDVFSDIAGKITKLYVSVGQNIRAGDNIAEVDPSKPGMDYIPGTAKSPISGRIVALPAQVGMTISQATSLARLTAGNSLELRVYVAERFISKISLGQNCEVTLDAWPGDVFQGKVREISPVVDPASRTMEIKISVPNTNNRLKVGMFAKVKIITAQKSGIVKIPAGALVTRFGKDFLFTVENDPADPSIKVARQKTITKGILIDSILEIQEGVKADEQVIVKGQTLLEDGARINIIDQIAPLTSGI
ncbi:efflux RND transporter periplasmic adaptor subunit [Breznakiellaceae bacterium SP9]